ncbi:hypothetical protein FHS18_005683 [Paenibacillus phyllosphaerae]|uniref:Uncharacterized protein n=1 Tax=Paenibacillus phyllosphaerae TaxID=274593 RepID=A0A7W5B4K9_9BACL|nr:hypothetical protein [Paenibacillus phyllosphaerae]MBB3113571.1 hypothetical protein [Paenibacillus phyllosphaerae]
MKPYLEFFFERLKKGEFINHPNVCALHQGLAYTWKDQERGAHLLFLPFEYTGLAYIEPNPNPGNIVNIAPYYMGEIMSDIFILRGTDLHKPKTEEDTLAVMYKNAYEINQKAEELGGSFEDYIWKFKQLCAFFRYYNSVVSVPVRRVKS